MNVRHCGRTNCGFEGGDMSYWTGDFGEDRLH